jgi:hypothetical protein
MAYRLKVSEKPAAGLIRIAEEQTARLADLDMAGRQRQVGVHETRKGLKRLRALLRLLAEHADKHALAAEQDRLRDLGRLLAGERASTVLPDTLVALAAECELDEDAVNAARRALGKRDADAVAPAKAEMDAEIAAGLAEFSRALPRLAEGLDINALVAAVGLAYERGRADLDRAYSDPGPESFHDLRKRVQLHWRHCQILSRSWPEAFAARIAAARELSGVLGRENDLTEFCQWLVAARGEALTVAVADRLLARALERRDELRAEARPLARRLFAERRGALERRFKAYWRAAVDTRRTAKRRQRSTVASRPVRTVH